MHPKALPTMTTTPWDDDADTLEAFLNGSDPSDDAVFAAQVARDDAAGDAALALFRAAYRDVAGFRSIPVAWTGLAALVVGATPELRERFVKDVLFAVPTPLFYGSLGPQALAVLGRDGLLDAIEAALAGDDAPAAMNALALPAVLYGRVGGPRLEDDGRERLDAAAEALAARDDAAPEVRAAARGWAAPHDALG
ncbi:MAG: hypothetical protein KC635_24700 [Myxococcales bacterium]|nr:hypothetical protein [Myxococcales bacterium]MCB9731882.1 hypothetical protein [Deltaproteobacteria bacterium]